MDATLKTKYIDEIINKADKTPGWASELSQTFDRESVHQMMTEAYDLGKAHASTTPIDCGFGAFPYEGIDPDDLRNEAYQAYIAHRDSLQTNASINKKEDEVPDLLRQIVALLTEQKDSIQNLCREPTCQDSSTFYID